MAAARNSLRQASRDLIFSCGICLESLTDVYAGLDAKGDRKPDALPPLPENTIVKFYMMHCGHLVCHNHLPPGKQASSRLRPSSVVVRVLLHCFASCCMACNMHRHLALSTDFYKSADMRAVGISKFARLRVRSVGRKEPSNTRLFHSMTLSIRRKASTIPSSRTSTFLCPRLIFRSPFPAWTPTP